MRLTLQIESKSQISRIKIENSRQKIYLSLPSPTLTDWPCAAPAITIIPITLPFKPVTSHSVKRQVPPIVPTVLTGLSCFRRITCQLHQSLKRSSRGIQPCRQNLTTINPSPCCPTYRRSLKRADSFCVSRAIARRQPSDLRVGRQSR